MLKRGIVPIVPPPTDEVNDVVHYALRRDPRHNCYSLYGFDHETLCDLTRRIRCPVLILKVIKETFTGK